MSKLEKEDDENSCSPTPEQIKERCLEVQKKWTVKDFKKRSILKEEENYTIPVCDVGGSFQEFNSELNIYRR